MGQSLTEIAKALKDADKKIQLIYAFNSSGKTRLSREFKELIDPKVTDEEEQEDSDVKILYYNAFTEDLFYWDNDLDYDTDRKLKIHPNNYTKWVLVEQGQGQNITTHFQRYTNDKLTPHFNEQYTIKDKNNNDIIIPANSEVHFSFERGNDDVPEFVKISKGEESCFIWSIFYSLLKEAVEALTPLGEAQEEVDLSTKIAETKSKEAKKAEKIAKKEGNDENIRKAEIAKREAEIAIIEANNAKDKLNNFSGMFDRLEYIFIDDPVSSLDEKHLIELAIDVAELVKSSNSRLKFIITTHNPLFYNVLYNEFNSKDPRFHFKESHCIKRRLEKLEENTYLLHDSNDSPFSYHLYLLSELEKAIVSGDIQKYHFNFIRNILEKTSTFFGHKRWEELLPDETEGARKSYFERILNLSSHGKHSGDEVFIIEENDKRRLGYLVKEIKKIYLHKEKNENNIEKDNDAV